MTVKRIRTFGANATLATAVALSVGLAGCTPAHFDPNSPANNPAAANPSTTAPGATTGGGSNTTGGGTNTTGDTTPAAAAQNVVLSGLAELSSGPMKNASIRVEDAITGKAMNIVAAGAGNIVAAGAGNIVAAGAGNYLLAQANSGTQYQTDDQGNYQLAIEGLAKDGLARIVVTSGDKTVTTLVSGEGSSLGDSIDEQGTYQLLKAFTPKKADLTFLLPSGWTSKPISNVRAKVTLSTTVTGEKVALSAKLQAQVNSLKGKLDILVKTGADDTAKVQKYFDANPGVAKAVENKDGAALDKALKDSGALANLTNQLLTVAQQFAAENPGKPLTAILPAADLKKIGLDVDPLTGNITQNGKVIVDVTKTTTVVNADNLDQGANDKSAVLNKEATVDAPIFTCGCFEPQVKVYYIGSTTTINVKQSVGQADIGEIVARFPGTGIFTGPAASTISTTGRTNDPIASGVGTANLSVDPETNATNLASFPNPLRAPKWGGLQLDTTKAVWRGYLNNGSTKVAYFQVFEADTYTYVATTYKLTDGVKTNSGHDTRLETTYLTLDATKNPEVFMRSRNGDEGYFLTKINTTGLSAFPAL